MKTPMLLCSHSSFTFLMPAVIGQIEKYVSSDIDIHFCIDNTFDLSKCQIPSNWKISRYDDGILYTTRMAILIDSLIQSDYFLLVHEDWIPTGFVKGEILDMMAKWMETNNVDYLLSYAHYSVVESQEGIPVEGYPDYRFYKEDSHIIQPEMWKTSTFKNFCTSLHKVRNQTEDQECLAFMRQRNCYSVQNYKTVRSLRTTNSLMFPHMHALSQGLWNSTKYPTLLSLLESYGIDTSSRGAHPWWELDTQ